MFKRARLSVFAVLAVAVAGVAFADPDATPHQIYEAAQSGHMAQAQQMIENIHMRQELSFDKDVQPVFHTEVQKTFTLFQSIMVISGVGALAAVLLGLFW